MIFRYDLPLHGFECPVWCKTNKRSLLTKGSLRSYSFCCRKLKVLRIVKVVAATHSTRRLGNEHYQGSECVVAHHVSIVSVPFSRKDGQPCFFLSGKAS